MTHITLPKEVAQQALEAIEELRYSSSTFKADKLSADAIAALRQHIEAGEVKPGKLTPYQKDAERTAFEQWYVENAFDYERDPLGSKLCGDQWAAWKYRSAAPQPKSELVNQQLLEALKAIIADGIHCDVVPHLHRKALAAVAAAEGVKK